MNILTNVKLIHMFFIKIDTSFGDGSDVFWQGLVENAPLHGPLM